MPIRRFIRILATSCLLFAALADGQIVRAESPLKFQVRTIETGAVLWWARALGDVNGNGLTDILLQDNNGHGGALRWYETREGGTAWTMHVIAERALNGQSFAVGALDAADINRNGHLDVLGLAHPGEWKQAAAATEIYWYQNPLPDGNPANDAWTAHPIGRAPAFIKDLKLADFNGDGHYDVLAGMNVGRARALGAKEFPVIVFLNQGDNKTWTECLITNEGIYNGQGGDLTGNGATDIFRLPSHDATVFEVLVNRSH
jgi:hypothetical protein